MAKPSQQELEMALKEAARMREQGEDPHHLASSLLSHHARLGHLEAVFLAVERYLRSGMSETEHEYLLKSLEKARQSEARMGGREPDALGLG